VLTLLLLPTLLLRGLCSTLADSTARSGAAPSAMCVGRQMHAPPLDFTHRQRRSLSLPLSAIDRFGPVGRQTGVRGGQVGRLPYRISRQQAGRLC